MAKVKTATRSPKNKPAGKIATATPTKPTADDKRAKAKAEKEALAEAERLAAWEANPGDEALALALHSRANGQGLAAVLGCAARIGRHDRNVIATARSRANLV